jgi:hypothetical protein
VGSQHVCGSQPPNGHCYADVDSMALPICPFCLMAGSFVYCCVGMPCHQLKSQRSRKCAQITCAACCRKIMPCCLVRAWLQADMVAPRGIHAPLMPVACLDVAENYARDLLVTVVYGSSPLEVNFLNLVAVTPADRTMLLTAFRALVRCVHATRLDPTEKFLKTKFLHLGGGKEHTPLKDLVVVCVCPALGG